MPELAAFLRERAKMPFAWGSNDCLMWLADWIVAVRGVDPAPDWRGTYSTRSGAARILLEAGGMAAHIDRVVAGVGVARTDSPRTGDIAVTQAPDGRQHGAITLDLGRVVILAERGLVLCSHPIQAAWRV